jgi:hypothetical protein
MEVKKNFSTTLIKDVYTQLKESLSWDSNAKTIDVLSFVKIRNRKAVESGLLIMAWHFSQCILTRTKSWGMTSKTMVKSAKNVMSTAVDRLLTTQWRI